jgi:hypothetical protein
MPFKSDKQQRWMWANEPRIAREWTDRYGAREGGGIMDWVGQGGMKNYLGEQPMVNAPKYWQSAPDHEMTELAYITPKERDVLVDMNMYGTMDGSPNEGPSGLMSLNGWGSTDPSQNRAGSSISAGMDASPSHADWGGASAAKHGSTQTKSGSTPADLKIAEQKNAATLGLDLSNKKDYQKFHSLGRYKVNPKTGRMGGGIGDLINFLIPGGMFRTGGFQNIVDGINKWQRGWRKKRSGYATQAEWEKARRDRINQKRVDYMFNRKNQGLGYGEENLNELLAQGYVPTVLQGNELGLFTDRMSTNPTHGDDLDNELALSTLDKITNSEDDLMDYDEHYTMGMPTSNLDKLTDESWIGEDQETEVGNYPTFRPKRKRKRGTFSNYISDKENEIVQNDDGINSVIDDRIMIADASTVQPPDFMWHSPQFKEGLDNSMYGGDRRLIGSKDGVNYYTGDIFPAGHVEYPSEADGITRYDFD